MLCGLRTGNTVGGMHEGRGGEGRRVTFLVACRVMLWDEMDWIRLGCGLDWRFEIQDAM